MPEATTTTTTGGADVSGTVANMLKVRAAQQGGQGYDYYAISGEELPGGTPTEVAAPPEVMFVSSANDLAIAARPAELAPVYPAPGLTERGWSPEVTARHPELVAAAMSERAGAGGATAEPIDPNDPAALAAAQRELGFAEVRKNNLRMGAMRLNSDRLWDGISAASDATPAAQAAYTEAVEAAKQTAAGDETPATAPAPAPASTPTTSTRTSSTSTTSATAPTTS